MKTIDKDIKLASKSTLIRVLWNDAIPHYKYIAGNNYVPFVVADNVRVDLDDLTLDQLKKMSRKDLQKLAFNLRYRTEMVI